MEMTLKRLPNRTYPALGFSITQRAVKESFAKRCSIAELEEIRAFFVKNGKLHCLYCGHNEPTRWDHVHPISQGGDTVKGNLVPACGACDDSKQDRTLDAWFSSNSQKKPAPERHEMIIRVISDYQRHFGYQVKQFFDKLTPGQREVYIGFQDKLKNLREYLAEKGITVKRQR